MKKKQKRYLRELAHYIVHVCDVDGKTRQARLDEVAAHLSAAESDGVPFSAAKAQLGSFEDICADLPKREMPRLGRRWAAALLLSLSAIFLLVAVLRLIYPDHVGLFADESGYVLHLSSVESGSGRDVLGHWFSLFFALLAGAVYWAHRYWAKLPRFRT